MNVNEKWKKWMYWASCCMHGWTQSKYVFVLLNAPVLELMYDRPASGLDCTTWLEWTRVVGISWYDNFSCFVIAEEVWMRRDVLENWRETFCCSCAILYGIWAAIGFADICPYPFWLNSLPWLLLLINLTCDYIICCTRMFWKHLFMWVSYLMFKTCVIFTGLFSSLLASGYYTVLDR